MIRDERRRQRRVAAVILALAGPAVLLQAVVVAPMAGAGLALDAGLPPPVQGLRWVAGAVIVLTLGGLLAGICALAAFGVWRDQRWGWAVGVAASSLLMCSGCAPIAVGALGVLLTAGVPESPPGESG